MARNISLPDFAPKSEGSSPSIPQHLGIFSRTLIGPVADQLLSSLLVVLALVLVDSLVSQIFRCFDRKHSLDGVKKELIALKKWSIWDMLQYIRTNSVAGVGGTRAHHRRRSKRLISVWIGSLAAVLGLELLIVVFSLPRQTHQMIHGSFLHMYPSRTFFKKSLSESCVRVNTVSDARYSDSGMTAVCAVRLPMAGNMFRIESSFENILASSTGSTGGLLVLAGNSTKQEILYLFARSISTSGGTLVHKSALSEDEFHGFHSIAFRAICGSKCANVNHASYAVKGMNIVMSTWENEVSFERSIVEISNALLSQTQVREDYVSESSNFSVPYGNLTGLLQDQLPSSGVTWVRTKEGPKLSLTTHLIAVAALLVLNAMASFSGGGDSAVDLALVALRSRIGSDACACGLFAVENDTCIHLGLTQTGPNTHHLDVYPNKLEKYEVSDSDTVC